MICLRANRLADTEAIAAAFVPMLRAGDCVVLAGEMGALWLGVQTLINMGVNMGLLPTKGLTLPLMSFGGSGILANCIALAILMRIDYENRAMMRGQPT